MQLLPIPADVKTLRDLLPHWSPFLRGITKRSKEPRADLIAKVARFQVQPILVWDEVAGKAVALLGIAYHMRGDDRIAEWIWMTGTGMKQWRHLLGDLEQYLVEHEGVKELRPICRPGWSRFLQTRGYKVTHYTMQKELSHGRQQPAASNTTDAAKP